MKNVLITGCCGFIGSYAFEYFVKKYKDCKFVGYDNLSYCGKLENIENVLSKYKNASFVKGDICDKDLVFDTLKNNDIDTIINLAAESHVDNSLENPYIFAETNVIGTLNLLDCVRRYWGNDTMGKLFYHVSTDEVFGSLKLGDEKFKETNVYAPNSPYSASKASSDYFVRAYNVSFNIPTIISHCSNNYGPRQYKEKLIPTIISCLINNKQIPVYGTGQNIRDWIYVGDHVDAIDLLIHEGQKKSTYNIGGNHEETNLSIINKIIDAYAYYTSKGNEDISKKAEEYRKLISFVPDRLGHDFRYAINTQKMKFNYGWQPQTNFDEGIKKTVKWYLENKDFLN